MFEEIWCSTFKIKYFNVEWLFFLLIGTLWLYFLHIFFQAGATFCQKRTTLERLLIVILLLFVLVTVILSALLAAKHVQYNIGEYMMMY